MKRIFTVLLVIVFIGTIFSTFAYAGGRERTRAHQFSSLGEGVGALSGKRHEAYAGMLIGEFFGSIFGMAEEDAYRQQRYQSQNQPIVIQERIIEKRIINGRVEEVVIIKEYRSNANINNSCQGHGHGRRGYYNNNRRHHYRRDYRHSNWGNNQHSYRSSHQAPYVKPGWKSGGVWRPLD